MATEGDMEMIEATAEQLGESLGIHKDTAYILIQFGEKMGWIQKSGNMPAKGGRGRGAYIYSIPVTFPDRIAQIWEQRKEIK